jgi:anti-sigma-K factor RskA
MQDDLHGLVAPFALHALDVDEERTFEEHLALCDRCREELAGLRDAAASLAYGASGPTPPPELRERILEQARAERPNVVPIARRRRNWTAPLGAAAAIAACLAIALGVWGATRSTSDPFAKVVSEPGARVVSMGDRGVVAVAPNGDAALALTVPRAPSGKTYEAWVIHGSNARPAGTFSGSPGTSVHKLGRPVDPGAVVAVTLERSGGVSRPTQEPLAATEAIS